MQANLSKLLIKVKKIFTSPITLTSFLTIHALLMNGYKFGWWGNLTIHAYYLPPALSRNDPALYSRDLFVNTAKQGIINSSYFWEIIAWLMKFISVEPLFFTLYLILFFLTLLTIFYLSFTLFKNKVVSCCVLLLYSFGLRQWTLGSPAMYFNFLHSALLATPLSLLSLTLFLKKRYYLCFFTCGILLNFHAMYTSFLLFIFLIFFLFHYKEISQKLILRCFLSFTIPAIPSIAFLIPQLSASYGGNEWLTAVKWTHWFHNFPSTWDWKTYIRFLLFFILFLLSLKKSPKGELKRTSLIFFFAIGILCIVATIFSEVIPIPFIIKFQFWRSTWIFILIATIYICNYLVLSWDKSIWKRFSIVGIGIVLTGYPAYTSNLYPDFSIIPLWLLPLLTIMLLISNLSLIHPRKGYYTDGFFCFLWGSIFLTQFLPGFKNSLLDLGTVNSIILSSLLIFLIFLKYTEKLIFLKSSLKSLYLLFSISFILVFDAGILVKQGGPHIDYGIWKEEKIHPWVDLQFYCEQNTPKDALIIVPPYMQGFKLFSRRSTFGDWLDGMLANWSNDEYAREWLKRMKALGWNKLRGEWDNYNSLTSSNFIKIAKEYKADFIVREKKYPLQLTKVYENEGFILYSINN